jgi:DNA-binding XRE family transcriptional regulator
MTLHRAKEEGMRKKMEAAKLARVAEETRVQIEKEVQMRVSELEIRSQVKEKVD